MFLKIIKWSYRRGEMHRLTLAASYVQEYNSHTKEQMIMQKDIIENMQSQYRNLQRIETEERGIR